MNYKRAIKLLGIILVLSIILVIGYIIIDSISQKSEIKKKIYLKEEERRFVSYNQLITDIKSIENGGKIKYAKIVNASNNQTSYGEGYLVIESDTSEGAIYEFYVNGRCVYISQVNNKKSSMTKKTKNTLLFIIIFIMGITEIIFYTKYKKDIKNNKIVEDKKSV